MGKSHVSGIKHNQTTAEVVLCNAEVVIRYFIPFWYGCPVVYHKDLIGLFWCVAHGGRLHRFTSRDDPFCSSTHFRLSLFRHPLVYVVRTHHPRSFLYVVILVI